MILDSDILIDILRERPAASAWFANLTELPLVAGMAALEVTYGCRDTVELQAVQTFLGVFSIVWPTEDDLQRALVEYAPLHLSQGLGVIDALIAATAVGRELPLATFNAKHFSGVPDLVIVQPYKR